MRPAGVSTGCSDLPRLYFVPVGSGAVAEIVKYLS
jgi:hypothetical protein